MKRAKKTKNKTATRCTDWEVDAPINIPPINTAMARKQFYDWLDAKRPWANCNNDAYAMMEQIVSMASLCFTRDRVASVKEVDALTEMVERFTEPLIDHPDNHDGPCMCLECRTAGD